MIGKGFGVWWIISYAVNGIGEMAFAVDEAAGTFVMLAQLWGTTVVLAAVLAVAFMVAFIRRMRGLAVARQKIKTRDPTFQEFSTVFSYSEVDKTILDVLETEPLEPGYRTGGE